MPASPKQARAEASDAFAALRQILVPYARYFAVVKDNSESYYLETREPRYKGKPMFFAAVRQGKAYTSFHLFPLYLEPGMKKDISPALLKRMQGKTCFNFTKVDEELFVELSKLTKSGFELFRVKRLV